MEALELILVIGLIISIVGNAVLVMFVLKQQASLKIQNAKLEERQVFSHFPELNPHPILRFDVNGTLLFANNAAKPIKAYWGIQKGSQLPTDWKSLVKRIVQKQDSEQFDIEHEKNSYLLTFMPVKNTKVVNVYGLDITEKQKAVQEVMKKTLYDPVTQLPNQTLILDYLKLHAERLKPNHRMFVLLITIADLGEIASIHPERVIDAMMNQIKNQLDAIKEDEATLGRLSQRTFALVESELFNHGQAINLAHKILAAFAKPLDVLGAAVFPQITIGISVYPDDSDNPEVVLRNAKLAQSRVLAEKKQVLFYQSGMDEQVQAKRKILVDLHQALARNELMVYYQPQWSISKKRFVGAEALIRWRHPTRGFISPFFFVAAAEESGLIIPIGRFVLETAAMHAAKLKSLGHNIKIAINLSAIQFMQEDIVEQIVTVIAKNKLTPDLFELEITEGVVIQDVQKTIEKMHALRKVGLSLAIDDFGTGYSSLSYLQQFPLQKLKIDRAFIKDIDTNRQSYNMTRGIVELGHSLNLNIVAEGAENKSQIALLEQMNCDIVQGYYYSKPLPFDEFVQRIS